MSISAVSGVSGGSGGTADDDVIWKLDPDIPVADQFREAIRDGGNTGVLAFEESVAEPYGRVLTYTAAAGSSGGSTGLVFKDPATGLDLALPVDPDGYSRYTFECRMGPLAGGSTYGYNGQIYSAIMPLYQSITRCVYAQRSATGLNWGGYNDNAANFYSTGDGTLLDDDRGGSIRMHINMRLPKAGVRPGGLHWTNDDTGRFQKFMTGGWLGTAPPNTPGAWGVGWEAGGPNLFGIMFYELGLAGKTYMSDIVIRKSPLSNG